MIINCTKCNTKYNINAKLIDNNGRKVKCIKCLNIWLVTPVQNEINNLFESKASEPFNYIEKIPEIKSEAVKSFSWFITSILIILILLLSLMLFKEKITTYYPRTQKIYDKLHYTSLNDLSLENVQVNKFNSKNESFLIIRAAIKNNSNIEQKIPNLLAVLTDKNKKEQNKKVIKIRQKLKPNELYEFEEIIFLIDKTSEQLTLELVNDIQLFLR